MAVDLSTFDGILKDYYTDIMVDITNHASPVQDLVSEASDPEWDGTGRQAIWFCNMGLNEGVGTGPEGAILPTPGNADPRQGQISMKSLYAALQLTKHVMTAAEGNKASYKNAMRFEFDGTEKNLKREIARMLFGRGDGTLALVNLGAGYALGATSVAVDSPGGYAGSLGGGKFLRKGMLVAFVHPTTFAIQATASVGSVNTAGDTITLSGTGLTGAVVDNSFIVRCNTVNAPTALDIARNNEPVGLGGLIDDGTNMATYFGLSRTTFPGLQSLVVSGGSLTHDFLQRTFDTTWQKSDGTAVDALIMESGVKRAYLAIAEGQRRWIGEDLGSMDIGTKAIARKGNLEVGGIPLIDDRNAPYSTIFGVVKANLKKFTRIQGEWADESGAIFKQVTTSRGMVDAFQAYYRQFFNWFYVDPKSSFRIDSISSTNVYTPSF